jgi:predicted ATPase/DNA-binding SARP family transcriptional activator
MADHVAPAGGLSLGVLGGVWAEVDGSRLALGGPRQRAVLAALIAARGSVLTLEQLVDAVWEDDPPAAAVGAVQTYISNLRRVLEPGRAARETSRVLVTAAPGYVLRVDPEAVDAWRFERSVRAAASIADAVQRREVLDAALTSWGGEPFAGLPPAGWVQAETARLRDERWAAAESLSAALVDAGAYGEAEACARAVTVEAPLREEGWRLLALAQYAGGRPGDGLATLRRARAVLSDELGIDPGPELRELEQQMLNREVPLAAPQLDVASSSASSASRASRTDAADDASHAEPGSVPESAEAAESAANAAPVTPTGSETSEPRSEKGGQLPTGEVAGAPVLLRPLLGRAAEEAAVSEAVRGARLVTITGTGGSGKTRLALAVAARLATDFADGARFVTLQQVNDVAAVWTVLVRSFELEVGASAEVAEVVVRALGQRQVLLVMDNLEHLDGIDAVVAALLAVPGLRILATSRGPLLLAGEQEFPLAALTLPTDDSVAAVEASGAGAFFCECARAARPGFALDTAAASSVAGLCRRLDGLPLALELAAAQLRFFTPAALLAHVQQHLSVDLGRGVTAGDRPERHRTLGATIAYSHDLLSDDDQVAFRRLGVFAGSVSVEAVSAVLLGSGDAGSTDVFGALSRLTLAGLLRVDSAEGEARFGMLDTIRDFARWKLESAGETDEMGSRHLSWCRDVTCAAWHRVNFEGESQPVVASILDEVRLALRFGLGTDATAASELDRVQTAVDLLNATAIEWFYLGGRTEAGAWIDRGLALLPDSDRSRYLELARQRVLQGLFIEARDLAELDRLLNLAPPDDLLLAARLHHARGLLSSPASLAVEEFRIAADLAERSGAQGLALTAIQSAGETMLHTPDWQGALDLVLPYLSDAPDLTLPLASHQLHMRVVASRALTGIGDVVAAGEYLSGASQSMRAVTGIDRHENRSNVTWAGMRLAAAIGRGVDAARLWGWLDGEHSAIGLAARLDAEAERDGWRVADLSTELGPAELASAARDGALLSETEALALVEDIARDAASRTEQSSTYSPEATTKTR